jgi:putative endonuclease
MQEVEKLLDRVIPESDKLKDYVYILLLEDNYYYVGYTNNIYKRMKLHFTGKGSDWTKLHKPIKIIKLLEGNTKTETQETLNLMKKKGSRVRGAGWCDVVMDSPPVELYDHFNWKPYYLAKAPNGTTLYYKYDGEKHVCLNGTTRNLFASINNELRAFKKLAKCKLFKSEEQEEEVI